MMSRWYRTVLLVFLLLVSTAWAGSAPRVVAVGDVHGDFDGLVSILQDARLIDAAHHWIGGKAVLVQTGDLLDRGPRPRDVLDLMMALEAEAPRAGGRVVALLGNHEVMNLMGDLRYVTPQEFAQFAGPRSEKLRDSGYAAYLGWRKRHEKAGVPLPPELSHADWMAQHPAGFFEHRDFFGPDGRYGRWLRQRPALFVLDDIAFVHGGFGPAVAVESLDSIERQVREEIAAFDRDMQVLAKSKVVLPFFTWEELREALQAEVNRRAAAGDRSQDATTAAITDLATAGNWLSVGPEGPLWFRGYDLETDAQAASEVTAFLKSHGIQHIVCAHTPQREGQIRSRFDGGVFLIDTGMLASSYPGGQPSALEIKDGKFTAIYKDRRVVLHSLAGETTSAAELRQQERRLSGGGSDEQEPNPYLTHQFIGPDGKPLPFKSDDEILDFLKTADVVGTKNTSTGVTDTKILTLEKGGVRARAVFRNVDKNTPVASFGAPGTQMGFNDSYIMEPAAYELSRYLGIPYVPPATLRTLRNEKGSVQLFVEHAMDQEKRKKIGAMPPDPSRWNNYIHTMHVWDSLVYNTDRNVGNILIDPDWNVWYIDHTRAFWRQTDLFTPKQIEKVERHFWERIQTMNHDQVRELLKPYLRKEEIDSLLKRQQKLIAYVQKLIREKGENNVLYTYTPPVIEVQPAK